MAAHGKGTATSQLTDAFAKMFAEQCTHAVVQEAEATGWAGALWDVVAEVGVPSISVPERAQGSGGALAEADDSAESPDGPEPAAADGGSGETKADKGTWGRRVATVRALCRAAAEPLPNAETGLLGGWLLASAGLEMPGGERSQSSPGGRRTACASLAIAPCTVTRTTWRGPVTLQSCA